MDTTTSIFILCLIYLCSKFYGAPFSRDSVIVNKPEIPHFVDENWRKNCCQCGSVSTEAASTQQ